MPTGGFQPPPPGPIPAPQPAPCLGNPVQTDTVEICGKCLDVVNSGTTDGTPVQIYDCNGSAAQKWINVSWDMNRRSALVNPNSQKCLDIPNDNAVPGTVLQIWTCNSSDAQQWDLPTAVDPTGFTKPTIVRNRPSGLVLDVPHSDFHASARPQLWSENDSAAQMWHFYPNTSGSGACAAWTWTVFGASAICLPGQ